MQPLVIPTDVVIQGRVSSQTMNVPAAAVGDSQVAAAAGIDATKLKHAHRNSFGQVYNASATTQRVLIHVAKAAGTIAEFRAGSVTACVGADTVAVDLLKNGATILTAAISLTSALAAFESALAAIATPAYVAGDVFEILITPTHGAGTLALGVFACPTFYESPQ